MDFYRPLDHALACAVLVGATPEQRAWLGGAAGDQRELDGADAAADELFCRAVARTATTPGCAAVCADATGYLGGSLPRKRSQAVAAHVEGCVECTWVLATLPGLADAVGTVASVYADTVIGPHEAPVATLRPVTATMPKHSRRTVIAAAAATVVGLAGVGAAVAQGLRSDDDPASVVVEDDQPDDGGRDRGALTRAPSSDPSGDAEPSDLPSADEVTPTPSPTPDPTTTPGTRPRATSGTGDAEPRRPVVPAPAPDPTTQAPVPDADATTQAPAPAPTTQAPDPDPTPQAPQPDPDPTTAPPQPDPDPTTAPTEPDPEPTGAGTAAPTTDPTEEP